MTLEQIHTPREQQHQQQAPHAGHDKAREHGNRIELLAEITEETLTDSEHQHDKSTRYEDGYQVLGWLVSAPWSERTVEIDRVLHDEHGSLLPDRIGEYVGLLLAGCSSRDARHEMVSRHGRRAERMRVARSAVAGAREVSAHLHNVADAPVARVQESVPRPALPAGSVPPQRSNGVPLPQRLVPPAPDEDPKWSTNQMLTALKDGTAGGAQVLSAGSVKALHDSGFGVRPAQDTPPAVAPSDPKFGASALPQARIDDTQIMSPFFDEDGEPAGEGAGIQAPPPFDGAASVSGPDAAASPSGADGDDDES